MGIPEKAIPANMLASFTRALGGMHQVLHYCDLQQISVKYAVMNW